ncbi:hypothetical protein TNCV_1070801 [Trichonephila clavipes]|nr:hypothetical protein TNCV_1070801 [Trichonephila clavipes]
MRQKSLRTSDVKGQMNMNSAVAKSLHLGVEGKLGEGVSSQVPSSSPVETSVINRLQGSNRLVSKWNSFKDKFTVERHLFLSNEAADWYFNHCRPSTSLRASYRRYQLPKEILTTNLLSQRETPKL